MEYKTTVYQKLGVPIPPYQELSDLLLLIYVFKTVQYTAVKVFGVCYCIGSGENGGGTNSKSHL